MKQLLIAFLLLSVSNLYAVELGVVNIQVPNLETTAFLEFCGNSVEKKIGATSKFFTIGDLIDGRIGYLEGGTYIGALGFDLEKLEKLGINVEYAWQGTLDISVGYWVGYNFHLQKGTNGLMAVFLKFYFTK